MKNLDDTRRLRLSSSSDGQTASFGRPTVGTVPRRDGKKAGEPNVSAALPRAPARWGERSNTALTHIEASR
jgi:hypothetical protein